MIAFDNGPANGDYVRYIDALMKGSVSTLATTLGANATMPIVATDGRLESDATMRTRGLDAGTRRAVKTAADTNAVANAIMQRAGSTDVVDLAALGKAAIAMIGGLLLAIVGVFMHPIGVLPIVAGVALIAAGLRNASRNAAALSRTSRRP